MPCTEFSRITTHSDRQICASLNATAVCSALFALFIGRFYFGRLTRLVVCGAVFTPDPCGLYPAIAF